jgi:hypothetical protein
MQESNENSLQLAKRRAERESLDLQEKSFRLEKELDKFKSRRERLGFGATASGDQN